MNVNAGQLQPVIQEFRVSTRLMQGIVAALMQDARANFVLLHDIKNNNDEQEAAHEQAYAEQQRNSMRSEVIAELAEAKAEAEAAEAAK